MKHADRESDLALLRDLTKHDEITSDESEAFGDMRKWLDGAVHSILSIKQRAWAESVADRLGISFTRRSAEQTANVPKGRVVAVPDVLSPNSLKAALAARRR